MKCKTCNGLGRTKATEFIGVDEGLRDVVILCPTCGGKGEIEQTEQEYIQTCNTEQLAEFLYDIAYFDNWSDAIMNDSLINETAVEYAIEKWLKQPHKE